MIPLIMCFIDVLYKFQRSRLNLDPLVFSATSTVILSEWWALSQEDDVGGDYV